MATPRMLTSQDVGCKVLNWFPIKHLTHKSQVMNDIIDTTRELWQSVCYGVPINWFPIKHLTHKSQVMNDIIDTTTLNKRAMAECLLWCPYQCLCWRAQHTVMLVQELLQQFLLLLQSLDLVRQCLVCVQVVIVFGAHLLHLLPSLDATLLCSDLVLLSLYQNLFPFIWTQQLQLNVQRERERERDLI